MTGFSILILALIGLLLMIATDVLVGGVLCKLADLCRLPSNKWTTYGINGLAAVMAPVVAFVLLACGTAVVVPPPQEFTYATMEVNPEATFWQRNVVYVALKTGYADIKVKPGRVYSIATWKISDTEEQKFIGLPGAGKWYKL